MAFVVKIKDLTILRGSILGEAVITGYFIRWVDGPNRTTNQKKFPTNTGFVARGREVADMWQKMPDAVLHIKEIG